MSYYEVEFMDGSLSGRVFIIALSEYYSTGTVVFWSNSRIKIKRKLN